MNVIIFGGSFNPVHIGHVLMSCYISSVYKPDKIVIIPVYNHVFGKDLEAFEHRYKMCEMAMGWIPNIIISDIEKEIGGASITARTVKYLKESNPDWNIRFVVGSDSASDLKAGKWEESDALLRMAEPLVIQRTSNASQLSGNEILPPISSTEIRASLKGQLMNTIAKTFLPLDVMNYIEEQMLYKPKSYQAEKNLIRKQGVDIRVRKVTM
jgi:nicotinate-nucleotide adenylyltransferase